MNKKLLSLVALLSVSMAGTLTFSSCCKKKSGEKKVEKKAKKAKKEAKKAIKKSKKKK